MELAKPYYKHKEVRLVGKKIIIPNVYALERLGAGHDGFVYKINDDIVVKILKYDVAQRKEKNLMTFQKANYFAENLSLKRIAVPIDTALDNDGIYTGYVMEYLDDLSKINSDSPKYKAPGDFTCGNLILAANELREDFNKLTKAKVLVNDVNEGSYIFTPDYVHLCDTDKYAIVDRITSDANLRMYNFVISKLVYYEMKSIIGDSKECSKLLSAWVKKCTNSGDYLKELSCEIGNDFRVPISEYAKYKVKSILQSK